MHLLFKRLSLHFCISLCLSQTHLQRCHAHSVDFLRPRLEVHLLLLHQILLLHVAVQDLHRFDALHVDGEVILSYVVVVRGLALRITDADVLQV